MRRFFSKPFVAQRGALALIAAATFVVIVSAIDPAGDYPDAPQGPGLTVDESFNVQEGVRLVYGLYNVMLGSLELRELFGDAEMLKGQEPPLGVHNPDHPPLGRIWLGCFHQIATAIAPPGDHDGPFLTVCARTGSAAAFALTVFLVGLITSHWYGQRAGIVAALALPLMPRLFGHAHLAALETGIGLTYLMAVVSIASLWTRSFLSPPFNSDTKQTAATSSVAPGWQTSAFTGAIWGLALLTKIQGILLVVPVGLWVLLNFRGRGVTLLAVWGIAGLAVFCIGWPWIWYDPIPHFLGYLGRTTNRVVLYVWYFGERFADRDVPWHFPWVMFLATVPVGLHLFGFCGVFGGDRTAWKERREQLLLGATFFPLLLFSVPRIAVYDGERLFLVSFPLWAIFIGRGGSIVWNWLEHRTSRKGAAVLLALVLAAQGYGLVACWPAHLAYYNMLVGGLSGANRLGLERDYWGDALARELLESAARLVPAGSRVDVAPVLHQFQLDDLEKQSPILRQRRIVLVPFDETRTTDTRYILMFRRLADLPAALRGDNPPGHVLAEVRRQGVQLAALYEWQPTGNAEPSPKPGPSQSMHNP